MYKFICYKPGKGFDIPDWKGKIPPPPMVKKPKPTEGLNIDELETNAKKIIYGPLGPVYQDYVAKEDLRNAKTMERIKKDSELMDKITGESQLCPMAHTIVLLGDAWNSYQHIPNGLQHPDDERDFRHAIHTAQRILYTQLYLKDNPKV